jgi:hypothetical protein
MINVEDVPTDTKIAEVINSIDDKEEASVTATAGVINIIWSNQLTQQLRK